MASQEAFNLTPYKTPKGRVRKNTFKTRIPDATFLADTIKKIAVTEMLSEERNGNPVQNIIVDNRDSKPLDQATVRVTAWFSDPKIMAMATYHILRELQKLTRKLTGAARGSFQIWSADSFKSPAKKRINAATSATQSTLEKLAATLPVGGQLIVVGPLVDYGRKLYWNPMGKTKDYEYKGRARYSAGYNADTGKILRVSLGRRNTNIFDLAAGRVRRRFPGVRIHGRWVRERTVNGDNRWPGVSIGLQTKGSLK